MAAVWARPRLLVPLGIGLIAVAVPAVLWLAPLLGGQNLAAPSAGTVRVGSPAPTFQLDLASGGVGRLSDQRGRVVLLNFWATWCEPCKSEMPALQGLAEDLGGAPFTLWAVNLQDDHQSINQFTSQLGLHMPILMDVDGDVTRSYGVRALPATFLIDKSGVLHAQRLGALVEGDASKTWSRAWVEQQVRDLLST